MFNPIGISRLASTNRFIIPLRRPSSLQKIETTAIILVKRPPNMQGNKKPFKANEIGGGDLALVLGVNLGVVIAGIYIRWKIEDWEMERHVNYPTDYWGSWR